MSYDPTRQVPPPGYVPPQPGYTQQGYQPQQIYPPQQAYPGSVPQPGYQPGYTPSQPIAPTPAYGSAPYPQYAPSGAVAGGGFDFNRFWQSIGLNGKAALLVGLLTLILFFLPWYASADPNGTETDTFTSSSSQSGPGSNGTATITISNTVTYSGFNAASGIEKLPQYNKRVSESDTTDVLRADGTTPPTVNLTLYLWLVPLAALALMVIAWLLSQRRLTSRAATIALSALSALILVMELSFLVAINSLQSDQERTISMLDTQISIHLNSTVYGLAWGFWVALFLALVGLGVGIYVLSQERKGLTPAVAVAQPYGGQYPGVPPMYPG